MPENEQATTEQKPAPEGSATPSGTSDAGAGNDGYDPQWIGKLTPRHKQDMEEFTKTLPVYKELETMRAEVGRKQKWGNYTKDVVESLTDPISTLDSYKALLVRNRIATEQEVEEARTPRELLLIAMGRSERATPAPAAGSKDGEQNPFFSQLDAWAKSRGIVPPDGAKKPAGTEALARGGSVATELVTADNIDALHAQGKVSDERYRAFLRTGQL